MNDKKNHIPEMISGSIKNVKELMDANSVIGEPIVAPNGTIVYPISRLNFGFGSAGSDYPTKNDKKEAFGGGTGVGATVQPVGFLVLGIDGTVKIIQIPTSSNTADKIVNMVPNVMDKVDEYVSKSKDKKKDTSKTDGKTSLDK